MYHLGAVTKYLGTHTYWDFLTLLGPLFFSPCIDGICSQIHSFAPACAGTSTFTFLVLFGVFFLRHSNRQGLNEGFSTFSNYCLSAAAPTTNFINANSPLLPTPSTKY